MPTFRVLSLALTVLLISASSVSAQDADQNVDIVPPDEIPAAPVLSPAEAIADFVVEDGFVVELVAAEPSVVDPIAIDFDEFGAIWVVEMRGYMPTTDGAGEDEPVGRVVVLRDLNKDGFFEDSQVFLDNLVLPRAIAVVKGGILLAVPPNLLYVENDNYSAGPTRVVDPRYAHENNPEHQENGLLRGLDNWYYNAKSDARYRYRDGSWIREQTEYRGQWGITKDDAGRLFYNYNSVVLSGDEYRPSIFRRNSHRPLQTSYPYGASRTSNRVYPRRVTPGVNRAYRPETLDDEGKLVNVTSAAGPGIYRGNSFPATHKGNAFVPEPAAYLVKRVVMKDEEGSISGSAPYEGREFLSSTDERFRPVNAYSAPDGSLYIVDMYRGIIQHATYLTDYLKRQIEMRDLATPLGLGRIYRIRPESASTSDYVIPGNAENSALVDMLAHPNGWHRDTAQRLLIERNARDQISSLRQVLLSGESDVQMLHALWTLDGLDLIDEDILRAAFSRGDRHTRASALELTRSLPSDTHGSIVVWLADVGSHDEDEYVSSVAAAILHHFSDASRDSAWKALAQIGSARSDSPRILDAVIGGLEDNESDFLTVVSDVHAISDRFLGAVEQAAGMALVSHGSDAVYVQKSDSSRFLTGLNLYNGNCAACHGADGNGLELLAPPLIRSHFVLQDDRRLTRLILDGLLGPVTVDGTTYEPPAVVGLMPGHRATISDEELADIMTFMRNAWGNRAPVVDAETVAHVRAESRDGNAMYSEADLYSSESDWTALFDGKTLSGWSQVNGTATYHVEDGQIVGTTVSGSPNSFLATDRHWTDFILEFEFKVDPSLNSGVQIRSNSDLEYRNGRVHGYQIEIDPSERAWTAGIYDESRRGWLFDLSRSPKARAAFKQNEWNLIRVEVRGHHFRTWINNVLAADMLDSMTAEGFIALQVHSIPRNAEPGKEVRWRKIRIRELTGTGSE